MDKHEENTRFYEEYIMPHYKYIKKFIYTVTFDNALSADITQETMESAWKHIERYKTYTNLKAVLTKAAKNKLNSHYRKWDNNVNALIGDDAFPEVAVPSNIWEHMEFNSVLDELRALFNGIRKEYLQIVLLVDYYDLSLKDAAKLLGINYSTAASFHKRALAELKAKGTRRKDIEDYIFAGLRGQRI